MQFIRENTSKVDELVKDKLDALQEVKSKEKEEKDLVGQQVASEVRTLHHRDGLDAHIHAQLHCSYLLVDAYQSVFSIYT